MGLPICLLIFGIYKELEFYYIRARKKYMFCLVEDDGLKYKKNIELNLIGDTITKLYCVIIILKLLFDITIK